MPRNMDNSLLAALSAGYVEPVHLVQLTFFSQTEYIWSGTGDLAWNGNAFKGVGSLGELGDVTESTEVKASGTSVRLSGIDPVFLAEALTDIWLGGPAYRWLGAVVPGTRTLIGTPYPLFVGQVDKPKVYNGPEARTIDLALETRFINHARPTNRRYTSADQAALGYPDDTGFRWVPITSDMALRWGS